MKELCPHCHRPRVTKVMDATDDCCMRDCDEFSEAVLVSVRARCEETRVDWLEELLAKAQPIVSHYEFTHGGELAKEIYGALERK